MALNEQLSRDNRVKCLPLKMLEEKFDDADANLRQLLQIDSFSFNNCHDIKEHGMNVKIAYKNYADVGRQYSKSLIKNGAYNHASQITSTRHELCSDCDDVIKIVNHRLEENGQELLSVLETSSVGSVACRSDQNLILPDEDTPFSVRQKVNKYFDSQQEVYLQDEDGQKQSQSNFNFEQLQIIDEVVSKETKVQSKPIVYQPDLQGKKVQFFELQKPSESPFLSTVGSGLNSNARSFQPSSSNPEKKEASSSFNENFAFNYQDSKPTLDKTDHSKNFFSTPQRQSFNLPIHNQSNPLFAHPQQDTLQTILAKQLLTKDLIKDSIEPFSGCPYKFWPWIQQIKNRTEYLTLTPGEYMQIMESNSVGEPKRVIQQFISSCGTIDANKAHEIFSNLVERFGSSSKITKDLLHTLSEFPPINNQNVEESLRSLLDLCRLMEFNMRDTPELQFMNIAQGVELVRQKLPKFLQDRWRSYGQDFEDKNNCQHPPFSYFIEFLNKQVREISNTNYKNIYLREKSSQQEKKNYKTFITKENEPTQTVQTAERFCFLHNVSNHSTADCRTFLKLPYADKQKKAFEHKLCYLCLQQHLMADCKAEIQCEKCFKKHCTAMHKDSSNKKEEKFISNKNASPDIKSMCTTICNDENNKKSCSKTLLVEVSLDSSPGKTLTCYAIIDEQSDCCLIDPQIPEFFKKSFPVQDYNLSTINGCNISTKGMLVSGLRVKGINEDTIIEIPPSFTNDTIPDNKCEVATPDIIAAHKDIRKFAKNFCKLDEEAKTLLLIGRNCGSAMQTRVFGTKSPWIHHTVLGWAAVGGTCVNDVNKRYNKVLKTTLSHEHYQVIPKFPINESKAQQRIEQDVYLEFDDDNDNGLSKDDEQFIALMKANLEVNNEGNIVVPLPFREMKQFPSNQEAVFNRTSNTLKRLQHHPNKLQQCLKSIEKNLIAEHIEIVPSNELNVKPGHSWFIPVFPVEHPRKGKVRLVYDASAKYSGVSLNDRLLSGPDFNNHLRGVLLRFRKGLIGFVADIENMFNNFKVAKEHKDYLRFYWFRDNSPSRDLIQYRSTSHIFGCTSSPAVANFCLRSTTNDLAEDKPLATDYIQNAFYVDDGLSSANCVEDAITTLTDSVGILSRFNIRLHKILSNSSEVLRAFPQSEVASGCYDIKFEEIPMQRTLGVMWDPEKDVFIIEVNPPDRAFTKRGILSVINSLYDPLGFVSPVSLAGRLIQRMVLPPKSKRDLELEQYGWDDTLPDKYLCHWNAWKSSLSSLSSIKIPRCYVPSTSFISAYRELHCFADASDKAIGHVTYLKSRNGDGEVCVSFVVGSSKVAPRAAHSIPRLELCAAVEAAMNTANVIKEIKEPISSVTYYSDSKVVLGYLTNRQRRFSRYVTRRVNIILSTSTISQWQYVSTKDNPADIGSRPHDPLDLVKSSWFKGPTFLWKNSQPDNIYLMPVTELPELEEEHTVLQVNIKDQCGLAMMCERVNNWIKAMRVVTLMLNFKNKLDLIQQSSNISLAPRKPIVTLEEAKFCLIKIAQKEVFHDVIQQIKQNRDLFSNDKMSELSPFLDSNNILRVGGRLGKSTIPSDCKHPILLPEKHIVTSLIIHYHHQKTAHQGRHLTHGSLRTNGYHIIHGKKVIGNLLKSCVTCRKLRSDTMIQLMAELPADRLEEVPPFCNSGIDVFGHYFIHDGKSTRSTTASKKIWVLISVCLVSRAVHLEMLSSMDTSSFKNALARFIAIRGTVKLLRSDNGSNFIAAKNQMKETTSINMSEIQNELKNKNVEWIFNPPHASHCGGVWERKVGSVKRVLEASMQLLGKRSLSRDEFSTLLQEAASIVNNTPLWEVSNLPDDPAPLTPAALITMKETTSPHVDNFSEIDLLAYGKNRWRRVQYLSEQFWIRWRRDYIQNLQSRNKWKSKVKSISVGDVVLIRNKTEKRNCWPLAKVLSVVKSADGLVRSVQLKLQSSKVLYRSIHDLVLLVSEY